MGSEIFIETKCLIQNKHLDFFEYISWPMLNEVLRELGTLLTNAEMQPKSLVQ